MASTKAQQQHISSWRNQQHQKSKRRSAYKHHVWHVASAAQAAGSINGVA